MDNIIVFGSKLCPDCQPAREYLTENNIEFLYLDITENLLYLKKFLKYRDERKEFHEIKKAGQIGIPCIVINDGERILFDYRELEV
ncbi:MAG: hypothetical protein GXY88_01100 [Tissierellia bacterium]|nr:hypothetical protein [Tissierellia bacterium]